MRIGQEEMIPSYYTRAPYTIEVYSDSYAGSVNYYRKTIADALDVVDFFSDESDVFCVAIFNQYGFEVYRDQKW